MKTFENIAYTIVDSKDCTDYGSGGIRTYMTLKAAERQFNSLAYHKYYKDNGYRIVRIGFEEV